MNGEANDIFEAAPCFYGPMEEGEIQFGTNEVDTVLHRTINTIKTASGSSSEQNNREMINKPMTTAPFFFTRMKNNGNYTTSGQT
jgi:hypothetical protein